MRKTVLISVFSSLCVFMEAQVPQGINYQAVATSATGAPIMNATIQVKAGILSDTLTPVVVWEELHQTVKTNAMGVFSLVIGNGVKQSGSASSFSSVNWTATTLYLKIQIYYQNTWKYMGTSQLWSVPYALSSGGTTDLTGLQNEINAIETGSGLNDNGTYTANSSSNYLTSATSLKNADDLLDTKVKSLDGSVTTNTANISALVTEVNAAETGAGLNSDGTYTANSTANYISGAASLKDADNKLDAQVKKNADNIAANSAKMSIKGTETSPDSALFRVVNKNGQTVFAVYNEGVRIYVDNGSKGKGGFSVGGFGSDKAESQKLLYVDSDSIRAYINADAAKASKGGFAIGGFSSTKAIVQDLLVVSSDSIRAYIDADPAKATKGGFAVGGFGSTKSTVQDLLVVSPDSIRAYIDTNPAKGAKGGFAVGGFSNVKSVPQDLLFVNADSIRAYIDTNTGKGAKGGFAVGGFSAGKGSGEEYLRVTRDSTRVYLNDTETKGAKGGFAVGGFGAMKGLTDNYMFIDPDSTRFYVHELGPDSSSTFNIVGINLDQTQTSLFAATTDTVGIGGVLNVQNNMTVTGDINYTGTVNLIVPEVSTLAPFNISENSAMVTGDIISDGGSVIIVSGVIWSTSPKPTVDVLTKTTDGGTSGQFTSQITGLLPSTTYYVKAYATNANGTGYGVEFSFTTPAAGTTMTDYDGNVYNTVVIGTQTWIAKNLKTTHLNDGTPIPNVTDDMAWSNLSTPGYAWYNHDAVSNIDYGPLYNWATVNTGLLCPTGWHVPSEAEISTLVSFLGGVPVAGGKLKEVGTRWLSPNTGATDEYGFSALPGGSRTYMGPFMDMGSIGSWWTTTKVSTDPTSVSMYSNTAEMMLSVSFEKAGLSVRCLKD